MIARSGIEPQALEEIKNVAGWVLLPLLGERVFDTQGLGVRGQELVAGDAGNARSQELGDRRQETGDAGERGTDVDLLRERFSFVYPYYAATEMPSKLTVTGLKGRYLDFEVLEDSLERVFDAQGLGVRGQGLVAGDAEDAQERSRNFAFERPGFVTERTELTATERGTALHLAMQFIDYSKCENEAGAEEEIGRLAENGVLSPEQADAVDVRKITRFFASETGKRIMRAQSVKREFKFSLMYPASQIYPIARLDTEDGPSTDAGGDKIMFQGVIDCFFEEEGELVVVDFKTDRVTPDSLEEKIAQYTPQLNAYAGAIERITEKKVKERTIYFFAIDESVMLT